MRIHYPCVGFLTSAAFLLTKKRGGFDLDGAQTSIYNYAGKDQGSIGLERIPCYHARRDKSCKYDHMNGGDEVDRVPYGLRPGP